MAQFKLAPKVFPPIEAHVTKQPHASVERARLHRRLGDWPRLEKCEAKSRAKPRPYLLGVRPTEHQTGSHALEQTRVRCDTTCTDNACKATHFCSDGSDARAASKEESCWWLVSCLFKFALPRSVLQKRKNSAFAAAAIFSQDAEQPA